MDIYRSVQDIDRTHSSTFHLMSEATTERGYLEWRHIADNTKDVENTVLTDLINNDELCYTSWQRQDLIVCEKYHRLATK